MTSVWLCMGYRDASAALLSEWLDWHIRLGVSKFLLHDDHSTAPNDAVLRPHLASGIVELLEPSPWSWREWIDSGIALPAPGAASALRFRFVGQHDMLSRCVATAVARDHVGWLAAIDLDEYLVPRSTRALPLAFAAAGNASCISVRRHNFYEAGGADGDPPSSVLRSRTRRAPFPPAPAQGQPFLPKWALRFPLESPSIVANMHQVWDASACRRACIGAAPQLHRDGGDSSGSGSSTGGAAQPAGHDGTRTKTSKARDDPAGLAGLMASWAQTAAAASPPASSSTVASPPFGDAQLRLVAALLAPLNPSCMHATAKGAMGWPCAISHLGVNTSSGAPLPPELRSCLETTGGGSGAKQRPDQPWCWREVCESGGAAEALLRIHHYGHAPHSDQAHQYDLARAGPAVEDPSALAFLPAPPRIKRDTHVR